jgi:DNA-binding SARP family transcriptional activator
VNAALSGRLDIRFFGQASVRCNAVPIKFAKRDRTIAMLARIILQRGAPLSREALAYSVFSDEDEATALAELRRYLYLAGKALPERSGEPWLISDSETVRWNSDAGAIIDVVAFEELARNPRTHEQAFDLYTGDLLEEIYDDWIVSERERLRARYLTILDESLARFRSARQYPAAIECAKRILSADPWREDTLRALMSTRYAAGDTAGALAEYGRFARQIRDELSIAPMPETVAVRQSILRNDAVPGALADAPGNASGKRTPAALLPFAGRTREMESLHAAWTRAARGTGTFVLIEGEAGAGKTRLTDEFCAVVQAEGGRVFVGTTAAPESNSYQAIVEALRSAMPLLQARPALAARRATLARLLPELHDEATSAIAPPVQSAERELARLYDALADALRRLASPRPALVVLEDLHWAGSATIEALGEIVKELVRVPIMIVATCRDEETPARHPLRMLVRSLGTLANVHEVDVPRFSIDEIRDLVARVDRLRERPPGFARDLHAQSEGNALFVSELISAELDADRASRTDASSIASVIASRIAHLSEAAITVAEVAAVAGAGCSISLVRDVSNLHGADVARGFDELLDRRMLREAGARANYDYVFTHHLIADAMYAGIAPDLRARRHSRIARRLESELQSKFPTPEREIARHHERAGEIGAAAEWYVKAADAAVQMHAYGDAVDLATLALRLTPPPGVEHDALVIRERAYGQRGERALQRADIDALQRLAGTDPLRQFNILMRRVLLARTLGESDEEGRLIAEMRAKADLDDRSRAQALIQAATHSGLRSRPAEALGPAREALAIYESIGDVRGQLECLYLLVDQTANVGDLAGSRAYLAQMHDRAANVADKVVEARATAVAAQAALLRADYQASYDLSVQALALQIETNDRDGEAQSRGRCAVSAAWLGNFAIALREFEHATETYASIGNKRGLALTYTNRTLLLMRLGLFEDAMVSIRQSNELFAVSQEERTVVANHVNASFVKLQLGDAAAAKVLANAAVELARQIAFPIFEAAALANLGNAERALGEFDAAIAHMEAGIALRRPLQESRDFVDDLADLALAYAGAGRSPDALAIASELCAIDEGAFESALWPHYPRWAVAQSYAAAGDHERAADSAARAQADLHRFAARIEDRRARDAFLAVPINAAIAGAAAV